LYVDDGEGLLDVDQAYLEQIRSFTVDTTISAREAQEWVREDRCLAIVSDYQMPVMDSIELLKRIRASGNSIPLILFTRKGSTRTGSSSSYQGIGKGTRRRSRGRCRVVYAWTPSSGSAGRTARSFTYV
jgi:DNA-binding NtrC family response regulator